MGKYVIIGGSAGGIGAIEAIKEVDPLGNITLISEESCPHYSRPMIADFLSGETTLEKMKYRDDSFWEAEQIQVVMGRRAVKLNVNERYVELGGEDRISFEKLLLATGAKSFVPNIDGVDKKGVFTFTSLSDAEHVALEIEKGKRAIVIGGGLIGVSVAEALMKCGVNVTIVELKDRILNLTLDEIASEILERAINGAGVRIIIGNTVQRVLGKKGKNATIGGVVLTNGEELLCDLLIFAIGVVPRTELVANTEVKVNRGIVVDEFMRTNIPDVYACGDVIESYDFVVGEYRHLPFWPLAYLGGRVAGYNMAGKKVAYPGGTITSALKYFGVPIISVGITNPREDSEYERHIVYDPKKILYKKIVLKDNVIVGVTLVNKLQQAGILFFLMKNYVNVKPFKQRLLSEDFDLASLPLSVRQKMGMMS